MYLADRELRHRHRLKLPTRKCYWGGRHQCSNLKLNTKYVCSVLARFKRKPPSREGKRGRGVISVSLTEAEECWGRLPPRLAWQSFPTTRRTEQTSHGGAPLRTLVHAASNQGLACVPAGLYDGDASQVVYLLTATVSVVAWPSFKYEGIYV